MPRNLPAELAPVMARLDRRWPEADEDALRGAAGLWREFGAEADRLGRRGVAAAQRVTGENAGPAVDAFADHWRGFSGGGRGPPPAPRHAGQGGHELVQLGAPVAGHVEAGRLLVTGQVQAQRAPQGAAVDHADQGAGLLQRDDVQQLLRAVAHPAGLVDDDHALGQRDEVVLDEQLADQAELAHQPRARPGDGVEGHDGPVVRLDRGDRLGDLLLHGGLTDRHLACSPWERARTPHVRARCTKPGA
ncbi:hypothetical protein [Kitasatospora sp. NPDC059571]|uniref:WXG100-like domain-containing protein n=1 Tax=Kitasatospora sp. NPDC059571 TaxID=3346871 RepID=UPI00368497B0